MTISDSFSYLNDADIIFQIGGDNHSNTKWQRRKNAGKPHDLIETMTQHHSISSGATQNGTLFYFFPKPLEDDVVPPPESGESSDFQSPLYHYPRNSIHSLNCFEK